MAVCECVACERVLLCVACDAAQLGVALAVALLDGVGNTEGAADGEPRAVPEFEPLDDDVPVIEFVGRVELTGVSETLALCETEALDVAVTDAVAVGIGDGGGDREPLILPVPDVEGWLVCVDDWEAGGVASDDLLADALGVTVADGTCVPEPDVVAVILGVPEAGTSTEHAQNLP